MKTVLITGVGRGIGLHLVEQFLQQGFEVIGTVRDESSKDNVEQLANSLSKCVEVHLLEVTDRQSIARLKKSLAGRKLDILINSAGVIGGDKQSISDLDFDAWEETLQTNTIAPVKITLAMLPNLKLSDNAKIVCLSSIMGSLARVKADSIAYRSSKAALNKAMQCLAVELQVHHIGVYLMHPGWVRTDMGGEGADISVEESSSALTQQILGFTMQHSGRFWQYDGEEIPW